MPELLHEGERVVWSEVGAGLPVLLLHSLGGAGAMWDDVASRLTSDFHLIAPDAPGHGGSELGPEPFTVARYARFALAVLDAAGIARTAVVGCSMGGHAAQALALDHPDRVARIVLANTSAGGVARDVAAARLAATRADLAQAGDEAFALAYVRSRLRADAPRAMAERYAAWVVSTLRRTYLEALEDILRQDFRRRLGQLSPPALVMTGTADVSTPPATARVLAALIPRARLEVLCGAGHFAPLDAAPALSDAVRDFLA